MASKAQILEMAEDIVAIAYADSMVEVELSKLLPLLKADVLANGGHVLTGDDLETFVCGEEEEGLKMAEWFPATHKYLNQLWE